MSFPAYNSLQVAQEGRLYIIHIRVGQIMGGFKRWCSQNATCSSPSNKHVFRRAVREKGKKIDLTGVILQMCTSCVNKNRAVES